MKRWMVYLGATIIMLCFTVYSCSSGRDSEQEKGGIEQLTDQIGQEAVEGITTPIKKARAVDEMATQRVKNMENIEHTE